MTQEHPITPPPELIQRWYKEACKDPYHGGTFFESKTLKYIAARASQWGYEKHEKELLDAMHTVEPVEAEVNSHITPPPELIEQWMQDHATRYDLARYAVQWGADTELEACCKLAEGWPGILTENGYALVDELLRAARRPKPPSLKKQALEALDEAVLRGDCINVSDALPTIRRALEQLDD